MVIKPIIAIGLCLTAAVQPVTADVVAVVSSKSPLTALSREQIVNIFLGKTVRFPNGTPAVPIDQEEGSPLRDEFYANFAGESAAQLKAHWTKILFTGRGRPPKVASTSAQVMKLIAADPQSIGYIERSALDSSVKILPEL